MHADKLKLQTDFLENHPHLAMTYCQAEYFSDRKDINRKPRQIMGKSDRETDTVIPEHRFELYWTTSSCLWNAASVRHPNAWRRLYAAEDILFDFITGLSNNKTGRTPGNDSLLYKRRHPEGISSNIFKDLSYQQEILKAYDLKVKAAEEKGVLNKHKNLLVRSYHEKIMTFLVYRRYWNRNTNRATMATQSDPADDVTMVPSKF